MILVLPGALPPAAVAAGLIRYLPERSPTLSGWLAASAAHVRELPVTEHACTPLQLWLLERAGYTPPAGVPMGAGWAVLEAAMAISDDESAPVWLADLAHLNVTQQGVTLLGSDSLQLANDEAGALIEVARPLLGENNIGAELATPAGRLRLRLPDTLHPYAPTPEAAAGREVQSWWWQDVHTRPWRRVLNMVQMAWHEHPANQVRISRGLPPVNALWLFGGGRRADFIAPAGSAGTQNVAPTIDDTLAQSARNEDWGAWLEALARLERERLAPLQALLTGRHSDTRRLQLVLTGEDRLASLTIEPPRGLRRWLRARPHDWRTWFAA